MQRFSYNFRLKDLELFCDTEICEQLNHLFGGNTDIDKFEMVKAMDSMKKQDREWVLQYFLYIEREIERRQKCYKLSRMLKFATLLNGIFVFILGIVYRMEDQMIYYILSLISVIIIFIVDWRLMNSVRRKIIFNQIRA